MSGHKQFIQLSIFDRLDNRSNFGFIGTSVSDIEIVRRSVLRDVENLLNTRRNIIVPPQNYEQLNHSLYVYGLDDFIAKNPKSPEIRQALKTSIKTTIEKFEPRLQGVSVDFNDEQCNDHNLCFAVTAVLFADPVQEPIYFDTWFSVNRGEYMIKDTN